MRWEKQLSVGLFASLSLGVAARAADIPVGSGPNLAYEVINFGDGAKYVFDVSYSGSATGITLFDIIEANSTLTTDRQFFDLGMGPVPFINGIFFNGHGDDGYAGGDNFWHYWTLNSGDSSWTESFIGASDRAVMNGDSDGWVYGSDSAPVPEPASILLIVAGGAAVLSRRPSSQRA